MFFKGNERGASKNNIKKNFFSIIDNVLGGAQSSTQQIAQNMSAIEHNLTNVSGISQFYHNDSMLE
jgi:hypothetical protein